MISAWLLLLQSLCITMSSNVSPLSMIGGVVATKMINARKPYDVALQYPSLFFVFRSSLNALILPASHTIKMHKASGFLALLSKSLNDGVAPKYLVSFFLLCGY